MSKHTYILSHLMAAIRKEPFSLKKKKGCCFGVGRGQVTVPAQDCGMMTTVWVQSKRRMSAQEPPWGPWKVTKTKGRAEGRPSLCCKRSSATWVLLNDDHTRGEEHKVYSSSGSHLLQPFPQDVEWGRNGESLSVMDWPGPFSKITDFHQSSANFLFSSENTR